MRAAETKESERLATDIMRLLQNAKWQVDGVDFENGFPPQEGIQVCARGTSGIGRRSAMNIARELHRLFPYTKAVRNCPLPQRSRGTSLLESDPDAIEVLIAPAPSTSVAKP